MFTLFASIHASGRPDLAYVTFHLFKDAKDARGRIGEPQDKPDFRDPDYKPTQDDLDRAKWRVLFRIHKTGQARKRAVARIEMSRSSEQGPCA